jgi:hypothetical protein
MLYYDFEAGAKAYKLRLNTRNVVALEKALGCNPLAVFGDGESLPTVTNLVAVLWASLQQYQHGITMNDAYEIFDNYLNDGNSVTDFVAIVLEIYKVSGLTPKAATEEDEKN